MESLRQTQKRYCSRAMIAAIFIGIALMLLGFIPIAKGLIIGAIFSTINFVIMGETLASRLNKSRKKSTFAALGSISVRFAIMAIPIVIAIRSDKFNIFAVFAGLFAVQAIIMSEHIYKHFFGAGKNSIKGGV